jgi:hypothetical protein
LKHIPGKRKDILIAEFSRSKRIGLSLVSLVGSLIGLGAAVTEVFNKTEDRLLFVFAALVFSWLQVYLLLELWRRRVLLANDGILVTSAWTPQVRKKYEDIAELERLGTELRMRFVDGSQVTISQEMADLEQVSRYCADRKSSLSRRQIR